MKTVSTLDLVGKLLERYEMIHGRPETYCGILAYYALAQAGIYGDKKDYLDKCISYLNQYPDDFEHSHFSLELYRAGGQAKAYLTYKGYMPEATELIGKYAELTLQAPTRDDGIICWYNDLNKQRIWIDSISAITPFMLYAGLTLNEDQYVDFAATQCFQIYEVLLDKTCGLVHQAQGFLENPKRVSADHWGRGNGWCLIGLAELIRYLPSDSKHRKKAEDYFVDMMESLLPFQSARGLWRQEITEPLAYEECSGTGLILYAMGIGLRVGLLQEEKYSNAFEKGMRALVAYCIADDFSTYHACPGCLCPAYPGAAQGSKEAYIAGRTSSTDDVHSYFAIMLALVEGYRHGIETVEITGTSKGYNKL